MARALPAGSTQLACVPASLSTSLRRSPTCPPSTLRLAADGDPNNVGHVITTTGGSGSGKQVIRYITERVVGNGSFGVVFQAKCLETGETVRTDCRRPRGKHRLRQGREWSAARRRGGEGQQAPAGGRVAALRAGIPSAPRTPRLCPASQVAIKKVLQDKRFKVRRSWGSGTAAAAGGGGAAAEVQELHRRAAAPARGSRAGAEACLCC